VMWAPLQEGACCGLVRWVLTMSLGLFLSVLPQASLQKLLESQNIYKILKKSLLWKVLRWSSLFCLE